MAPDQVQYYFQLAQHHAVTMQQHQAQQQQQQQQQAQQAPPQQQQQQLTTQVQQAQVAASTQPQTIITSVPQQQIVTMAVSLYLLRTFFKLLRKKLWKAKQDYCQISVVTKLETLAIILAQTTLLYFSNVIKFFFKPF